ncbi:Uncharacterised protein [Mycobacteroides abscessus subsp. abscessus]|nr:Uncharacterised protein [Mycobacteroides abscessus subsp. abscessus]SKU56447.1 Uncharacterised protein [Mycobacteroides abscessus subsp. abscessus]
MVTSRGSQASRPVQCPFSTYRPDEPLSATVSAMVMSQFAILLSTISSAAHMASTAARTCDGPRSPLSRSSPSRNAISASIFGCRRRSLGTCCKAETSMSDNNTPKSGWWTPS